MPRKSTIVLNIRFLISIVSLGFVFTTPFIVVAQSNPKNGTATEYFDIRDYGSAAPGKLATRVSLQRGRTTIAELIRSIAGQANLSITFDSEAATLVKNVNIEDATAAVALTKVLDGSGLHAMVSGNWNIVVVADASSQPASRLLQLKTQTIRGSVIDRHTKSPLPGASIVLTDQSPPIGTITDTDGLYAITNVSLGRHDIEVRFLGFETVRRTGILVGSAKEVVLNFELTEQVISGEDIVVTPTQEKDRPVNDLAVVSARAFSVEETRRYAGGLDDPARLASAFAGVATTGNVSDNALIIRGNAPKGVLWRLEGVEIPNPSHFAELNISGGGAVTLFSSQLLDNSDFLTGAFPAEYGNALAGVFDIHLRRGNTERREHTFQFGIIGLDFATEGPFKPGSNSSYLVNYRYSTLGLLLPLLPINGLLTYQDLSFKTSFEVGKQGRLEFWGIGGIDGQSQDEEDDPSTWRLEMDSERFNLAVHTGATGVNYRRLLGNRSYLTATAAATGNRTRVQKWQAYPDAPLEKEFNISKTNLEQLVRVSLNHKFSSRILTKTGVSTKRFTYDVDNLTLLESGQPLTQVSAGSGTSWITSGYSQFRFELNRSLTADVGLHVQHFALNRETSFEPRGSIRYRIDGQNTVSVGYGLHSRAEDLQVYLSQTGDEGDENLESSLQRNRDLKMTKARHVVVGYDRSLGEASRVRIEGYYQYLFDVPLEIGTHFSMLNFSQDLEFRRALRNDGAGQNYGVDLTVERFLKNGYYFLLTGSAFSSTYRGSDAVWRSTRYDQRYSANALAGKEIVISRTGSIVGLNLRFGTTGGSFRSPVDVAESIARQTVVFDESQIFVDRNPAQNILDLTVTYRRNRARSSSVWALQVKNVLAQGQPNYEFDLMAQQLDESKEVIILPLLSYKIEF